MGFGCTVVRDEKPRLSFGILALDKVALFTAGERWEKENDLLVERLKLVLFGKTYGWLERGIAEQEVGYEPRIGALANTYSLMHTFYDIPLSQGQSRHRAELFTAK